MTMKEDLETIEFELTLLSKGGADSAATIALEAFQRVLGESLRKFRAGMTTPNFCKNRLHDHRDFYTCGNVTLPGNTYCLACRPEKLNAAQRLMQAKETAYIAAKTAYEALLAEGVPK